jgi:hypothetical protein
VAKYELTFADWDACLAGGGCNGYTPNDQGWGHGQQPVINVNWYDAQAYVAWLSAVTGRTYRLLSEAEYEYAMRAGTTTVYPWVMKLKSKERRWPTAAVAAANGITYCKRRRLGPSLRTSLVSTTWLAMSGSGPRIASTKITTLHRQTARRGWKPMAAIAAAVSSAAEAGPTLHPTSAPRSAFGSPPAQGFSTLASGSPEGLHLSSKHFAALHFGRNWHKASLCGVATNGRFPVHNGHRCLHDNVGIDLDIKIRLQRRLAERTIAKGRNLFTISVRLTAVMERQRRLTLA